MYIVCTCIKFPQQKTEKKCTYIHMSVHREETRIITFYNSNDRFMVAKIKILIF